MSARYQIVDAKGTPVGQPFKSARLAYEAKRVYQEHCSDVALPLKVIRVDDMEECEAEVAA